MSDINFNVYRSYVTSLVTTAHCRCGRMSRGMRWDVRTFFKGFFNVLQQNGRDNFCVFFFND